MAFSIKDPETDAAVRKLAVLTGRSLTDAIKVAATHEYERLRRARPLEDRIAQLHQQLSGYKRTGRAADKAFYDDL